MVIGQATRPFEGSSNPRSKTPDNMVELHGLVPEWATDEADQGALPMPIQIPHLTVFLSRPAQNEWGFQDLLLEQQNRSSALYHRWYSAKQIGQRFGPPADQLEEVVKWLRDSGLQVLSVSNSRVFIEVSGDTEVLSAALGIQFHLYKVAGKTRVSIDGDPSVPRSLALIISSISGLSTEIGETTLHSSGSHPLFTNCHGANCAHYIAPNDFAAIYDATPVYQKGLTGSGRVIGIIGMAEVYGADINAFNSVTDSSVPIPTVFVPPMGTDPGPALSAPPDGCSGDDQPPICSYFDYQKEATLDIQRAGSVAPGASLELIVSADTGGDPGILVATEYAVDGGPTIPVDILSLSFLSCETGATSVQANTWNSLFQQAAAEGISVFVAAGDSDATSCEKHFETPVPNNQFLSINYLCASGSVTCMGGSEFNDTASPSLYWGSANSEGLESALSYIPEGAWNDPIQQNGGVTSYVVEGTGGGFSQFIPAPPWQATVNTDLGRAVPDAAFSSSCHDAYFVCMAADGGSCVKDSSGNFHFSAFCGTSAATPSMAGVMALVGQANGSSQGNPNPGLYELAGNPSNGVFHDITIASSGVSDCSLDSASMCNNTSPSASAITGGTLGYQLESGFDKVTGWGSVDIGNLIANWKAAPSLLASPPTISVGAPGMAGSTVLTAIGFPSSAVTFSCSNLPQGVECEFGQLSLDNTITLNVTTTSSALELLPPTSRDWSATYTLVIPISTLILLSLCTLHFPRKKVLVVSVALLGIITTMGCGNHHTPKGTSTIVVTAVAGSVSASTNVQLSVE
jgi:subtilase family serine protease